MLCASGYEFEEKLHAAMVEQENARRALQSHPGLNGSGSKRLEDAVKRYDSRLADFVNHKRVCTLCKDSKMVNGSRAPVSRRIRKSG
jgi:hypothetical protein